MPDDKTQDEKLRDQALQELTHLTEDVGGYDTELFGALDACCCGGTGLLPILDFDGAGEPVKTDEVACPFCQPQEEPGDL